MIVLNDTSCPALKTWNNTHMNKKMSLTKKISLTLLALVLVVTGSLYYWYRTSLVFGAPMNDAQKQLYVESDHFFENQFTNLIETTMDQSFGAMFGALTDYLTAQNLAPRKNIEVMRIEAHALENPGENTQIVWFGHSSFLLQTQQQTVLFDPIFSNFAAPHSSLGSPRYNQELPIQPEQLPSIDAVIISHDHYDHLDYDTLMRIDDKVKHYFVPLGVGQHLMHWGIQSERISELDWWQSKTLSPLTITLTPARHFSGRRLSNNNATLWGGWMIESADERIFFSGDSGYGPHFKDIGERFGDIDIALLDTGQYNFRWEAVHMSPKQSLKAAKELNANILMPVHWGAFTLAIHPWDEPAEQTQKFANEQGQAFIVPQIGEVFVLKQEPKARKFWWRDY